MGRIVTNTIIPQGNVCLNTLGLKRNETEIWLIPYSVYQCVFKVATCSDKF